MILQPPAKEDFDFQRDIRVDTENKGFMPEEIQQLAKSHAGEGEKGGADSWKKLWGLNRKVPPEIQNLKSEFGYQSNPFLTDLVAVARAQNTREYDSGVAASP